MHARTTISLLVTLLIVGACAGGGASPDPTDPGSDPAGLDGRTFLSTDITGRDLVDGSQVRLTFQGNQLGIHAGCNSMSGTFAIDGDRLTTGQIGGTDMGCDPALMDQDTWIAEFLREAQIALDGDTLTLTRADTTITLVDREVADPDRELVGTRWVLDSIITGDAVSSVPLGVAAAIEFTGAEVVVEAGCNSGRGPVTITETTLEFEAITTTVMACEAPAMAVEQAVLAALSGTVGYEIEAGTLTIRGGEDGLVFRAED